MNLATPELRDLALRILARGGDAGEVVRFAAAEQFCGRLSTVLSKLAGPAGSRTLLSRALVLAGQEAQCLTVVQLRSDGQLHGFEENTSEKEQAEWNEASIVLVAQLLGLLHTFIGKRLTVQLVEEAWPMPPEKRPDVSNEPTP